MFIAGPLILVATLTGAAGPGTAPPAASTPAAHRLTLSDAVHAAARQELLRADRAQSPGALRPGSQGTRRRSARPSVMTRATAIVAGAVIGSLAGMAGGAAVDMALSNGECFTGMSVGMPVGAVLGAVFTARVVR
jgi:hypothetical protein